MSNQNVPHIPVSEEALKKSIDAIFFQGDYRTFFKTMFRVIRFGLDYSSGNPIKNSFRYYMQLNQERRRRWYKTHGTCYTKHWGCGGRRKVYIIGGEKGRK